MAIFIYKNYANFELTFSSINVNIKVILKTVNMAFTEGD